MKAPTESNRKPYVDDGINHVGWVVDDVEALRQKAIEAGYRTGDLYLEGEGSRKRAYIFDSVGNEWEFVEYLSDEDTKRNVYE